MDMEYSYTFYLCNFNLWTYYLSAYTSKLKDYYFVVPNSNPVSRSVFYTSLLCNLDLEFDVERGLDETN